MIQAPLRCGLVVMFLSLCPVIHGAEKPASIFKEVRKSVVVIESLDKFGKRIGTGAGFAVEKGVIATNVHVLEGGSRFKVTRSDGKVAVGTGIWEFDRDHDVALLQLDDPEGDGNIPALEFASGEDVSIGDTVYVIGHPEGLRFSITQGIISATDRRLNELADDLPGVEVIQTDAATSKGSSGGPWVNSEGKVVGIHRAGLSSLKAQGFNFATHAKYVSRLLERERKKLLPKDHFGEVEDVIGPKWKALFPVAKAKTLKDLPIRSLEDLHFEGPGVGDPNMIGKYRPDAGWNLSDGSLIPAGNNGALGLGKAEDFQLQGVANFDGTGGVFLIVGWDGENGHLMWNTTLRANVRWATHPIRDGKAIAGGERSHSTAFRPTGWQPFKVTVEEGKLTVQVGEATVVDRDPLPDYEGGEIILGTYDCQYGPKPLQIRGLKIRSR